MATLVNTEVTLYINGIPKSSSTLNGTIMDSSNIFTIGGKWEQAVYPSGTKRWMLKGRIDEVGIWSTALSPSEVLGLYQRGANRLSFQVRTCSSEDCSDQDAHDNKGWQGPGGNHLTYFSELYNNDNMNSSCSIPQACYQNEILLSGNILGTNPQIYFNSFGSNALSLSGNQYFQYRVFFESDDQGLSCEGETKSCSPLLEKVEIGPSR